MGKRQSPQLSIGERLRQQRVEKLRKGLREMARLLDTAPAHITDIESGRRSPSEDLLLRMAAAYQVPEHELRSGFSKPDAIVQELASESPTASEKVPELLRSARGLSAEQYDKLIQHARKISKEKGGSDS